MNPGIVALLVLGFLFLAGWALNAWASCGHGCEQSTDVTGPYVDPECPKHGWIVGA